MLILILVLRYTITVMRELGIGSVLPLDNNIYLHKVVGYLIFFQAWFHTIMHLCNFGKKKFIFAKIEKVAAKNGTPSLCVL